MTSIKYVTVWSRRAYLLVVLGPVYQLRKGRGRGNFGKIDPIYLATPLKRTFGISEPPLHLGQVLVINQVIPI